MSRDAVRESVIRALMGFAAEERPRSTAERVAENVMRAVDGYASAQRALIEQQIADHVATREQAARAEEHGVVLSEVAQERARQDATWGEQSHGDGTGGHIAKRTAELARELCRAAAKDGRLTWTQILREEVSEAVAEVEPAKLRDELIQVAAVAVAWVESIDRRAGGTP